MGVFRVLVFGATGAGKTSLCNTLTGQDMPISNSARGVTFKSSVFEPIQLGDDTLIVTDTIGLNEIDTGTMSSVLAVTELVKLIHESVEGYNLLIHVMKAPRITKSHKDNYDLFYKKIVKQDIPIILVVTGCENDDPMSKWATENAQHFKDDGFEYKQVLSTCFAKEGRFSSVYDPLRFESRTMVIDAIFKNALPLSKKIYFDQLSFDELLKRSWNYFCEITGISEKVRFQVGESSYEFLVRIGVAEDVAKMITKIDLTPIAIKLLKGFFDKKI